MNCLITKQGKVIENGCIPHDVFCKRRFGYDLAAFLLKQNGIRVMLSIRPDTIAIEYHNKPSAIQLRAIHKILHADDYYTVILATKTIERFRPIRSI